MATPDYTSIPLTKGYVAIVDNSDSDLAHFKWQSRPHGRTCYARRNTKRVNGKRPNIHLHHVIMSRMLGRDLLPSERVDHKDGNGLNNRRGNLRLATHTQNMRNKRTQSNNQTGLKGVSKDGNRYVARIWLNNKNVHLGMFESAELAAIAYNTAAAEHFKEFAKPNL